jgi:outer membrane murein-binding lipoprotein Lpp
MALPQGFSVVLVQGDLQTAAATDDVPPAARKALADMKDFLPYKSYKLLDAAWILCCSGHGYPRSLGDVVTQLKGPEDREYELTLSASAADSPRVNVRFFLRDVTTPPPGAKPAKEDEEAVEEAKKRIAELEAKVATLRQKYTAQNPEVRKAENELAGARRRLEAVDGRGIGPMAAARRLAGRGIIDTSFAMDVGETVVVGTSRLRGGSRALIALLTAVPPKGTTERRE